MMQRERRKGLQSGGGGNKTKQAQGQSEEGNGKRVSLGLQEAKVSSNAVARIFQGHIRRPRRGGTEARADKMGTFYSGNTVQRDAMLGLDLTARPVASFGLASRWESVRVCLPRGGGDTAAAIMPFDDGALQPGTTYKHSQSAGVQVRKHAG
jgi:hypothetical protein